ncbi:MAG: ABC transporter permease [Candidatus Obscuribacter sp.]|jgi:ABC-2 type transport system permease protein|nr:ABC transporter permease [Candidatus Obscuribacter sp.]MBP6349600.1 ABC transporter permease [Candidatus Obscuribacter sp.]MBP7578178.1 ABC transporter permease [Candidatus Obscuribacter sp.]
MQTQLPRRVYRLQIRALMRKELQQIFRDKQLMFLLFFMPILQIFIYGFALSPEVEHLRLGVIDQSNGIISRDLTADLLVNGVFDLSPSGGTEAALSRRVQDGKLDAGVVIPPDMERLVKANRTARVQVLLDGVDANTAGIANGYINQIVNSANRQLAVSANRSGQVPVQVVSPQISFAYNPGLISSWFFVPGVIALVLNLVSTLVSSAALVREKDSGTLEQLLMTPVNSHQILLAKVVPLSMLLMLTVFVALGVATLVFHVPFRGNFFLFLFVSFMAILVGISIGIALAAYSQNQRQSLLTSFFINLPVIQLSGAIAPLESMPEFFQWLSILDPLRYYVTCVRCIVLKGVGLEEIWPNVLALAAYAFVLLALSSSRFRKQLK